MVSPIRLIYSDKTYFARAVIQVLTDPGVLLGDYSAGLGRHW